MDSRRYAGAVSIFAVIFSALLLTVLTVGFIGLMVSGQQRAINNDLSQSAYDAALAGVEDAKRVVRQCLEGGGEAATRACAQLAEPHDCKVIARAGIAGSETEQETLIQSSNGRGSEFDQAYTCVNITMDTPHYRTTSLEGEVNLVPLRATRGFDTIIVEWFTRRDMPAGSDTSPATVPSMAVGLPQANEVSWPRTAPPLLRAQVIAPGDSFRTDDLDSSDASQTIFLRPTSVAPGSTVGNSTASVDFSALNRVEYGRAHAGNSPRSLTCSSDFGNDAVYSCRAVFAVDPVTVSASANALLRLTTIYNQADIRVSLRSGDETVLFDGVQPVVDSTGRANNVFRRVDAGLRLGQDIPITGNVVEVINSLCKDFSVGISSAAAGSCRP